LTVLMNLRKKNVFAQKNSHSLIHNNVYYGTPVPKNAFKTITTTTIKITTTLAVWPLLYL
jgi:hypothetical protein